MVERVEQEDDDEDEEQEEVMIKSKNLKFIQRPTTAQPNSNTNID